MRADRSTGAGTERSGRGAGHRSSAGRLTVAGVAVGVWAMLPHFASPAINTTQRVEIADHVVPGAVVILVSATALVVARRSAPSGLFMFVAGLVICLAGLWMAATHVPLIGQAMRGDEGVTWRATLWHSASAAAVAAVGVVWAARYWAEVET